MKINVSYYYYYIRGPIIHKNHKFVAQFLHFSSATIVFILYNFRISSAGVEDQIREVKQNKTKIREVDDILCWG